MAAEAGQKYFEGVGDDMEPDTDSMPIRTFPQLTETGNDESVVFAFIVFESREHRDEVNAKVFDDPAMDPERFDEGMPFDSECMAYGGFRSIVSYEK